MEDETYKDTLIKLAEKHKCFVTAEDGYVMFVPAPNGGFIPANQLRIIADELDRRNKEWDDHVNNFFNL